jgi:hypothetical protein
MSFANEQAFGNDLVGTSGGHLLEHFDLSFCQHVVHCMLRKFGGYFSWNSTLPRIDRSDGVQ